LAAMNHAELIKRRLEEIEAEISGVPRRLPSAAGRSGPEILAHRYNFIDHSDWLDRQPRLAAERRRLLLEYERLPKSAKSET
jgi:hypothetical protein